MRKLIYGCFVIIFIVTITSCNFFCDNSRGVLKLNNNFVSIGSEVSSNIKEAKSVANTWVKLMEKIIKSDKLTKVEISLINCSPEAESFISEKKSIIDRWKSLITKFKCTIIPYSIYVGGITKLNFYDGEEIISSSIIPSGFEIFYITVKEENFMVRIDNYEELQNEIVTLLSDMGLPYSLIPGAPVID